MAIWDEIHRANAATNILQAGTASAATVSVNTSLAERRNALGSQSEPHVVNRRFQPVPLKSMKPRKIGRQIFNHACHPGFVLRSLFRRSLDPTRAKDKFLNITTDIGVLGESCERRSTSVDSLELHVGVQ